MGAARLAFNMIHNSLQTQATEHAPTARGSAVALFAAGLFAGQGRGLLLLARWRRPSASRRRCG